LRNRDVTTSITRSLSLAESTWAKDRSAENRSQLISQGVCVLGRLVVHGDPAATAANILAHQLLFRLGFAAQIIAQVLQIPLAVIFFDLFKIVVSGKSICIDLQGISDRAVHCR